MQKGGYALRSLRLSPNKDPLTLFSQRAHLLRGTQTSSECNDHSRIPHRAL
jgi:hypothetical protein